jgi:hypothetical protein
MTSNSHSLLMSSGSSGISLLSAAVLALLLLLLSLTAVVAAAEEEVGTQDVDVGDIFCIKKTSLYIHCSKATL